MALYLTDSTAPNGQKYLEFPSIRRLHDGGDAPFAHVGSHGATRAPQRVLSLLPYSLCASLKRYEVLYVPPKIHPP